MPAIRSQTQHLSQECSSIPDAAVARALKTIQERFAEDGLNIATVAREAGVSKSVLQDRFAQLVGASPMRYRTKWRMRIAADMLCEGKTNTANIAYAVGFGSEAAFNRAFKREFGSPPAAWKRRSSDVLAYDKRPHQLFVSGTTTMLNWISRYIGDFVDRNPDLSVQLAPNSRKVDFAVDDVDCALRCSANLPSGVEAEELFKLDFTPMCGPEFLATHRIESPADLLDVARITPSDPWWEIWSRRFGLEEPANPPRGVEMGAQLLDGIAAIGGQGVALLTPRFWSEDLADGRLVCPLPQILNGNEGYWFVYPSPRAAWPKIRRFSEWLHRLVARSALRSYPEVSALRAA